jgi:hypothetical protein
MLTAIPLHYMRDLYGSVSDDYSFQVMLIGEGARILFMHRCRPGAPKGFAYRLIRPDGL